MRFLSCTRKPLDPAWVKAEAKRIADLIVTQAKPRAVYLFGSASEGKMTDQSDFDFLVIVEGAHSLRASQRTLLPFYPLSEYPVDIVWVTEERFERMKLLGGICFVVHEEGRCLYPLMEISSYD